MTRVVIWRGRQDPGEARRPQEPVLGPPADRLASHVAKARNDNWNVNDITSRMPWHDPQLAGEITTDHAAAAACSTVPTFDVAPDGDGALLSYGGPLSLEQANARLADLDVALQLGLPPTDPPGRQPAVTSISSAGGDPSSALALEDAVDAAGEADTSSHPFASGGLLACSGLPGMTPAEAHDWLDERFAQVRIVHHGHDTSYDDNDIPDGAALVWADAIDTSAWVGIALAGDPRFDDGWRVPAVDTGGCS